MCGEQLLIRMYNVGFGDSLLIRLPGGQTILIDAGFHAQGKGQYSGNELAEQIKRDVTDGLGTPRIDVVIATHRHQDHVFAFNSSVWEDVEVGEVWMPWVEDRDNPKAVKLWKKKSAFVEELKGLLPTFGLDQKELDHINFELWNAGADIDGYLGLLPGWSNQGALDTLYEGFKSRDRRRPRFLPQSQTYPESFESDVLPGVKVHVLGPPRDPALIEELDPEADGETYRAFTLRAADLKTGSASSISPFALPWHVAETEEGLEEALDYSARERMESLARSADPTFAADAVDGMINSTSLVLLLEIGKARLLLPGDAEWGTWKRILASSQARELLEGATFFKVGHHGSHNATSPTLVTKVLPRNIPAMIPTQEGAGKYRNNIPLGALLDALTHRGIRYARSDVEHREMTDEFERDPDNRWVDLLLPW